MKKLLFIIAFSCAVSTALAQQDAQYTQNQFNSNLVINPAYAGAAQSTSFGMRYRKQWTNMEGSPRTMGLTAETALAKDKLGIGLCVNNDKAGINQSTNIDLNIAYHLKLSENARFAFGLKGGIDFIKSEFSELVNVNPGDPLYGVNQNYTLPYVGAGALYYNQKFYIGLSVPRIVSFESPGVRTTVNKQHFYLYGGVKIELDENLQLRPALLTKYQPQAPLELDLAADLWYRNTVAVGMAYRTGDALNLMAKLKYQKLYLGYSYDFNLSGLRYFNHGSHEVFLGLEFKRKQNDELQERNRNIRYF